MTELAGRVGALTSVVVVNPRMERICPGGVDRREVAVVQVERRVLIIDDDEDIANPRFVRAPAKPPMPHALASAPPAPMQAQSTTAQALLHGAEEILHVEWLLEVGVCPDAPRLLCRAAVRGDRQDRQRIAMGHAQAGRDAVAVQHR